MNISLSFCGGGPSPALTSGRTVTTVDPGSGIANDTNESIGGGTLTAMSSMTAWARGRGRRRIVVGETREREEAEPKPAPGLVRQGGRSEFPRSQPTADDWLRDFLIAGRARGGWQAIE